MAEDATRSRPHGLLRRNPAFRRLWLARAVSFLGDAMGLVALILYTVDTAGTGAAVGMLLLAGDFTPTLASPIVGAIADRLAPRRAMVAAEVAQCAAVAAIAVLAPPLPGLLALVAAQSLFANLFRAASRRAVTEIVDDDDLEAANALVGAGTHGLDALGPLAAAALLAVLEPRWVLAADAATFAVSAALLARLPLPARPPRDAEAPGDGVVADARAGLRALWSDRSVRRLAIGFVVVVAFTGVDDVALAFLAADLGASDSGAGLLYAGTGAGLLAGFAVLARRRPAAATLGMAVTGFGLASAGNLLTGIAPALALAVGTQVVRGAGLSLVEVGATTVVQRRIPAALQGRVFANLYGAVGLAAAVSYAAGGPLIDALSARAVLVAGGAGGVAATLVLARGARGMAAGRAGVTRG